MPDGGVHLLSPVPFQPSYGSCSRSAVQSSPSLFGSLSAACSSNKFIFHPTEWCQLRNCKGVFWQVKYISLLLSHGGAHLFKWAPKLFTSLWQSPVHHEVNRDLIIMVKWLNSLGKSAISPWKTLMLLQASIWIPDEWAELLSWGLQAALIQGHAQFPKCHCFIHPCSQFCCMTLSSNDIWLKKHILVHAQKCSRQHPVIS